ncbi:hypothetical protein [Sphingobacterium sp. 2149]|jgi:WD40 repeat protein|uniref:hypothetical protein n=1 Tax=Sphingobacterium sp. 2149 TaxID=2817763 RepID=UPI00285A1163|nr:hypothetical protein [Sphingobacterium sp. 2149]MDR6734137.1 WD40 repeat protein [Sphingobacterium sp. 2149]
MENTLENKAKFFAQYWGQNVRFWTLNGPSILSKVGHTYMTKAILDSSTLELKPISTLSNEDAIRLFDLRKYDKIEITRHFSGKDHVGVEFKWVDDFINNADGFSYSSIGLSIPEITHKQAMLAISMGYYIGDRIEIDYGWVKLKEQIK